MLEVREISKSKQNEWRDFVLQQPFTLFTQSPANGLFYESMDEQYWIFGLYNNNQLMGGSLVVSVHARRGNFLLLPYGPILNYSNQHEVRTFISFLRDFAKQQRYDFIRISPFIDNTPTHSSALTLNGCKKAPLHILAENTWILNITNTEEVLLKQMKKNHRNLISRCQREGVTIRQTGGPEAVARLNAMHDIVAERHDFSRFSKTFIEKEYSVLNAKEEVVIFEAVLPNGDIDASAMIYFFGNMAAYRHSASLHKEKHIPTSYLIQWEVIKEAKRRGKTWYNFWGVAPENAAKDHPFAGITHFKKGFGGEQKDLLPAYDLPISSFYYINWIIETFRRMKRGF